MEQPLKSITVFCGSSTGSEKIYTQEGFLLGQKLAAEKIRLVYGGASIGIMGAVADGCLTGGGTVIGVIPSFLSTKEIAHAHLTELITVKTMHERKLKMHELSDGFMMLPGGIGTLEEFFEIFTWAQLGLHQKPIGILNTAGYYDDLVHFISNMVQKQFVKPVHKHLILVSSNMDDLLLHMKRYQAPDISKFISPETT